MKALDVVTFGEAMAMFIADQVGDLKDISQFTRNIAGAETNVAAGLSRLGLRVGFMSKVGDDPFGHYLLDVLREEGIDTSRVQVDPNYPTAFLLKSKVTEGDPQVHYFRKGSAASTLAPADLDHSYLTGARHLHMTGIPPALSETARQFAKTAIQEMRAAGGTVSFDPNLRPSLWKSKQEMVETINQLAFQADLVLPGVAEGEVLTGTRDPRQIADFYLAQGVKLVVVKLGPEGAFYKSAAHEGIVPGFLVEQVVDTVGAGDGFAVGVISALLEGLSIEEAVRRGNAIGALAVMSPGDMDGYPTRAALELYLLEGKRSA